LGLMLLHQARNSARFGAEGEPILLADQDRTLWNRDLIAEGTALVDRAFATREIGPYALQGAIAAVHMAAASAAETDWVEILGLYSVLGRVAPSPVVQLNRAIAIGMVHGPAAALRQINALLAGGDLVDYHLAHLAQAEMLRRLGRLPEAVAAYQRALSLCALEPEQQFLLRRIIEIAG